MERSGLQQMVQLEKISKVLNKDCESFFAQ